MKNINNSKNVKINFDRYSKCFFGETSFHLRNIVFSPNNEISLEQQIWNFAFLNKFNHSIATTLCANLLNHHLNKINNSARHNSMTKLCRALFKYENKM